MKFTFFDLRTSSKPAALSIHQGSEVTLPAGVQVRSTNPARKQYVTRRSQVVRVHHTLAGQFVSVREALDEFGDTLAARGFDLTILQKWRLKNAAEYYHLMVQIEEPLVCWAGSGGYWCEAKIRDVQTASADRNCDAFKEIA